MNAAFEARRTGGQGTQRPLEPSTKVAFSGFLLFVGFRSWCQLSLDGERFTLERNTPCPPFWEPLSAASICCSDKCSYFKYITISSLAEWFASSPHSKQPCWRRATSWWKEFGQTEDITPREERKEGGACLQKLGAKPTSVS